MSRSQSDNGVEVYRWLTQAECIGAANELTGSSYTRSDLNLQATFTGPPGCYVNSVDGNLYYNGIPNGAPTDTTTEENYLPPSAGITMMCHRTYTSPVETKTYAANPCELYAAEVKAAAEAAAAMAKPKRVVNHRPTVNKFRKQIRRMYS